MRSDEKPRWLKQASTLQKWARKQPDSEVTRAILYQIDDFGRNIVALSGCLDYFHGRPDGIDPEDVLQEFGMSINEALEIIPELNLSVYDVQAHGAKFTALMAQSFRLQEQLIVLDEMYSKHIQD